MNTLLSDMLGRNVYVYLNDVIIYNKYPESHFRTLEEVLSRLKNAGLKAKLTKCEFLKERISFLGHQVDHAGRQNQSSPELPSTPERRQGPLVSRVVWILQILREGIFHNCVTTDYEGRSISNAPDPLPIAVD